MIEEQSVPYVHDEEVHNLEAPGAIVPLLCEALGPTSVVDVGCGTGTFLRCFKDIGVEDVFGVDGSWFDPSKLWANIEQDEFLEADLSAPLELGRRFDLAISLEVAEHLPPEAADTFVESLCGLSSVIVFSAAMPMQGGQHHLNEQWPEYWIEKFEARGYKAHDVLRPALWDNDKVFWWYRQNAMLLTAAGHEEAAAGFGPHTARPIWSAIHPDHLAQKVETIEQILGGGLGVRGYVGLLAGAIGKKLRGGGG